MTVKLTIDVEIDDDIFGKSEDEILWMENEILVGDGTLILHSNDIGDDVGVVRKVTNIRWFF